MEVHHIRDSTISLYDHFYRSSFDSNFRFSITEREGNTLNVFIDLLDKKYNINSIGNDFLFRYFVFQFLYWSNTELKHFNKKVNFNLIIGSKAFKRWLDRDTEFDFTLYDTWALNKLNVEKTYFLKKIEKEDNKSELNISEETEKKRLYGKVEGLNHCIEFTTMYDRKSRHCFECKFKVDCIEVQRVNLPTVYKHRNGKNIRQFSSRAI